MVAAIAAAGLTAFSISFARARLAPPAGPRTAVLVTATKSPAPPRVPSTATTSRPAPTTTTPLTTTTTRRPPTTTPTRASAATTTTVRSRATCLARADTNHYTVVAANSRWFHEQVRNLPADKVLAAQLFEALRIEEARALAEIDAQYSIDRSNCYLE